MSANKIVVTNAAAFVAAIASAATNDTTCIEIQLSANDDLILTAPVVIPPDLFANSAKRLIIEGNGVTIRCIVGGFGINTALIGRNSNTDNTSCSFVFRNINFDCIGSQMYCLNLQNATDVIIENCKFNNCKRGLFLKNINTATVNNCVVNNSTEYGFYCDISNNIVYNNSKVIGATSSARATCIGWSLNNIQTVELNNSQIQGGIYTGVEYIITQTSVYSNLKINNITINALANTGVKLVMNSGFAQIDGVYLTNLFAGYVIDASSINLPIGSTLPHLYVKNIPLLSSNSTFKTVGGVPANSPCNIPQPSNVVVWEFYEVADGDNIWSAARWDDGYVPYYRYAEFFSESKTILTNAMTINSKPI